MLWAHSTLGQAQRAVAAFPVCSECPHESAELMAACHSSSSHQIDRPATPAVLLMRLVGAGGAPHAASGLGSAERPASKQTGGSDAGEYRGVVRACLLEHSMRGRSLRSRTPGVHPAGDGVRPALSEHVGSDFSAARGSFSTGQSQSQTTRPGLDGQGEQRERRRSASARIDPSFTWRLPRVDLYCVYSRHISREWRVRM